MREGFKGGDFDAHMVNSSRDWALDFKGDFVKKNYYIRGTFPHTRDRKSTRLNSSHALISYAVFCLKKKKKKTHNKQQQQKTKQNNKKKKKNKKTTNHYENQLTS